MKRVAIVVGPDYEDSEFQQPYDFLKENGCTVDVIGTEKGQKLEGKRRRSRTQSSHGVAEVRPEDYDALVIPGGYAPDKLRLNKNMVGFVRQIFQMGKPVFAICHAGQLLIEADVVRGRTLTAWPSIWTDLRNAGATVVDEPLVKDDNLYTSRRPADLPPFLRALGEALGLVVREETSVRK
ncbi:MAG: type 1 glutamine amidotransferase domain-containing protein [Terriglobia bacterium]